jgi:polysaccharide biosynthesis/export protein
MTSLLLLFALQAPPGPQPPARPPAATTAQSPNADYRVGLQDRLNVTVLGIADFSAQNLLVENDGKFDYINLGRIQAQDRTVQEIQRDVRELLIAKQMHLNPAVTVDVSEFRSQMVYVSGAVKDPKGFKITGNETLMNVLAQAGFLPSSGSYVEVTRNKPLPSRKYRFERKALETGTAEPFRLQDQDTIVVPESEKAYVRGEVKSPGTYEVTSNMTVLQLVISAGDLTEKASNGRVSISRPSANGGKPLAIKVPKDLSTIVLPGDTISVGRRIL